MQLIGMLDSPFVRRVAISFKLLDCPFEHRSVSVFRQMEQFRQLNPVIKAPTLVCDDGTVLMDSSLILDYAEALTGRSLMPSALDDRRHALRVVGLALAAMEKSVQVYYERNLRPEDKRLDSWLERIQTQMLAAFTLLDGELAAKFPEISALDQAGISAAVAWRFAQENLGQALAWPELSVLRRWGAQAEALPVFLDTPFNG